MATVQDLFTALRSADEAGNVEDATRIAEIIHGLGYGERPAAAPKEEPKKRTMGEAATDIAASLGSGIGQLAQLPGQVGTLAGIYGPQDLDTGLQGAGRQLQQFAESKKTDILKQKEAARSKKIQEQEGFFNEAKTAITSTITDPALLTSFFAEQVPNLVGSFGFGALTKGGTKLLMRNATEQALQKAGVTGAIGGGAIMQGADIGTDTYEETLARLKKNDPNIDPAKANELALSAGRKAAIEAAAISIGASYLPGGSTIERALVGRNLPGATGFVRGTLGETLGEGIEEGGGALVKNLAMADVVPGVDIGKGVGAATGLGALGGFMFGAPSSLAGGKPLPDQVATLPQVRPRQQQPDLVETLPPEVTGRSAESIRQEQLAQAAEAEAARAEQEASAQEAARGLPGFAGAPDINAELVAAARADKAEEQKRLEAERKAQIKQIENTQFSTDPFQDQMLRNRALQQFEQAPAPEAQAAPEAKPANPLEELTQEIPEGPALRHKAPPKQVPMSAEDAKDMRSAKQNLADIEKQITEAKKGGTDLFNRLKGAMSYQDVLEVAPEVGNKYRSRDADTAKKVDKYKKLVDPTGKGASLSSMVADGSLNEYLPPDMRIGEPGADESAAVQYIYDKLSSGDTRSFDEAQALKGLEDQRDTLQQVINEPQRRAELNYEAQRAAAEQRGTEPLSFGDLIADAQSQGVDTDAVMERVAMQMPAETTPAQYQGEVRNQIETELAAKEGRVAGQPPVMEELRQQKEKGGTYGTAEGAKIEKELTGKNFDQLVQWSINNAPNRFNKLVAQKVAAMIKALKANGVEMQFDLQSGNSRNVKMRGAEGITTFLFSDEGTNVFLQLNGEPVYQNQMGYPSGMSYGTIQHELLHVATRTATRWLPKNHPAIKDLNELYGQVVDQYNKDARAGKLPPVLQKYYERRNNALESADELITWGLTDRDFQDYLSNIKVGPKQTAFNKLVSLVRELLGIAKPFETAMEKLVRTTDSILDVDVELLKGSMQKLGYAMGRAKPPTTQLKQQSLFSKRVQQMLQDDLAVRKNGFYFDAKDSPLYQTRTPEQARMVTQQDFDAAVMGTKTGQRIMDKNIQIKDGDYVGVRLDLNILRSTGVPVQSIHQGKEATHEKGAGFYNGEVIKYAPWVTLKNVRFKIQQGAREKIASGKETKSPMGSADGQYVKTDKPNFDGIELRFNPNREHLFRDALGRAVKYADEITTTRNGVFARGNIEYFGQEDVPPVAISPSESRLMQEGEMTAKQEAAQTGKVSQPIQDELFMRNGLGQQDLFADKEDIALSNFLKSSKEKRILYHGTNQGEIKSFIDHPTKRVPSGYMWGQKGDETYKRAIFLTPEPKFANHFAKSGTKSAGEDAGKYAVYPVYAKVENPFDYENPKHIEMLEKFFQKQYNDWHKQNPSAQRMPDVNLKGLAKDSGVNFLEIESPEMQYAIQQLGFDSFYVLEGGVKNIGVYDPKRIKSALGKPSAYRIEENLLKASAPTPTQLGADSMEMLAGIGRTVAEPEPGYVARASQAWDNARDNPKATREAAYGKFRNFLDGIETSIFSSDAALNNQIRNEVMNSMAGQEQKIGTLLDVSLSQTAHSDAIANLFIMEGNIKYDKELHKWVGVKDDNNIINLSKKLDEIADKAGLTKPEVELLAHTAFEARRTQELNQFNEKIQRQSAAMKQMAAEERAAGRPVAASVLNEKANNLLKKVKVTTNMSPEALQTGLKLYDMHPGLKEVTKIWNGIRQNALDRLVETGLYTAEEAEMLMSAADYVPFFREDQIEGNKGPKEFLRSLAVQADKRLKGSSKPVNDIFDNMVRWTQYAINRGVRNRSGVSLAKTAVENGLAHRVVKKVDQATAEEIGEKDLSKLIAREDAQNIVKVWEDGKQVEYSMQDPLFMSAFQGLESVAIPTVKFFSKFADILRQSVVLYPLFSVAQVPQDSFAAMFTSGLKPQHALSIPMRAIKEFYKTLRGTSSSHEVLKNVGAVGVRDFTSAIIRADAEIAAGLKEEKGLWNGIKRRLGNVAMAADNAVRQATYEAAIAQGLSKSEAIEKAFEIFNVRRRGDSKALALAGQVIPFFNAYLAAQHVAYRTLTGVGTSPTERKAALQTLAATTGSVMALSVLYAMMNGDDDDYLNKPTPTRDRLLMIPGTGVSIPLRSDIFALPKVLAEHTYLLMTDNGYEDPAKFRASVASLLANSFLSPTTVPQAIKPLIEVGINYDFFQEKPLVGVFQQRRDLDKQFENSTSEFSKALAKVPVTYNFTKGEWEGLSSPIGLDHMIRGMFGSFGGLFLYATNPILASVSGTPRPEMTMQDALATIPNASTFVTKEYEIGLRKDFYALKEATDKVGATLSYMKQNSPQELADYLSDETVRARYALTPAVNQIAQQLTTIRNAVTAVSQAPEERMNEEEKQLKIKQLREAEKKLLQGVNIKALRERAKL